MALQPRSVEDIYADVRGRLENRITKVTNFVTGSFNNAFLVAHSAKVQEAEIKALAAELAGAVDYAGKDLTQSDLNRLGIEDVDPERINQYMDDEQLDRLAANFNISRDEGERATGTIVLETSSSTTITNGMEVGTQPDASGRYQTYFVVEGSASDFDPDSNEIISLDEGENELEIIAADVGQEFNVGGDTVTYIPNPQPSIQEVRNIEPIDGGENEEINESLRSRIKSSVFDSSDGGTELGMSSYIERNASDPVDVNIDEFEDENPPFVDVVIDGGEDDELVVLIDESRPTGIRHNLARPNEVTFSIFTSLVGEDIDTDLLESDIIFEINEIGLGGSFSSSSLLNTIISSQDEIESVPALNTYISESTRESHVFDEAQNVYELDQSPLGRVNNEEHSVIENQSTYKLFYSGVDENNISVEVIIDDQLEDLEQDTNFTLIDSDDDGEYDSIELNGINPDIGTTIRVEYVHSSVGIEHVEAADGTVFDEGGDYGLIDDDGDGIPDSIDWSVGGDSPDSSERFSVDYTANRTFEGDKFAEDRQLFNTDTVRIEVE